MKVAIGLEYHGAAFFGWQSQAGGNTVQDVVEEALSWVADEPVRVHAAGRTDSGVHAALMPAHFSSTRRRQPSAWVSGANARLPPTVRVLWSKAVADSFGARRTAVARHYGYVLTQRAERPALLASLSGFCHVPLDVAAMRRAAGALVGEHDFSAFRASACQARTPVRRLLRVDIRQEGSLFFFIFAATVFFIIWCAMLSVLCWRSAGGGSRRSGWASCWRGAIAVWPRRPRSLTGCIFVGPSIRRISICRRRSAFPVSSLPFHDIMALAMGLIGVWMDGGGFVPRVP